MTKKELCRISHLLFILDTYLFQEPGREDLCREIARCCILIVEVNRL